MIKNKKYIGGIVAFVIFVAASIFGIMCCALHSLISIWGQGGEFLNNLFKEIQSAFWIEVILLFAMLAICGIVFALILAKKANKIKIQSQQ